jgi:hypothetical protein
VPLDVGAHLFLDGTVEGVPGQCDARFAPG